MVTRFIEYKVLHYKDGADYAEAETNYREAVGLQPLVPGYRTGLAKALLYQQKYSEATVQVQKALELDQKEARLTR